MVNFASTVSSALAAASLLSLATAHPGEKHDHAHVKRQIDARQLRAAAAKRSLGACENSLKHRDLMARSVQRRANALNSLRSKRGISVSKLKPLAHYWIQRSDTDPSRRLQEAPS